MALAVLAGQGPGRTWKVLEESCRCRAKDRMSWFRARTRSQGVSWRAERWQRVGARPGTGTQDQLALPPPGAGFWCVDKFWSGSAGTGLGPGPKRGGPGADVHIACAW